MKYSIFTNIYNHNPNYSVPRNWNKFKVYHSNSIEEVRDIISKVNASGHTVFKVTTALGTWVNI